MEMVIIMMNQKSSEDSQIEERIKLLTITEARASRYAISRR